MSKGQKAVLLGLTGVTSLAFGIPAIVIGVQWMGTAHVSLQLPD